MKTRFAVMASFIMLLFPLVTSAQFRIVPYAGFGSNTQTWRYRGNSLRDNDIHPTAKLGYDLGVKMGYKVTDIGSVTLGLSVASKGVVHRYGEDWISDPDSYRLRVQTHWMVIPIGFETAPLTSLDVRLEAGLNLAGAISGKFTAVSVFDGERDKDSERFTFGSSRTDELFSTDVGLFFGGSFSLIEGLVDIGGRLNLGLRNISVDPDGLILNHSLIGFVAVPFEFDLF